MGFDISDQSGAVFKKFPSHEKVFLRAVEMLGADKRVDGVYLSGSFAKGTPDKYSDIDLHVLVSKEVITDVVREHSGKYSEISKVATMFPGTHLGDPNMMIVFFEGDDGLPIHTDFSYLAPENMVVKAKNKDVVILLDRVGLLADYKARCQVVGDDVEPKLDKLQYFEDRFWAWCWYTYAKIARGELWEARDAIEYMRSKVILRLAYYFEKLPNEGNRRIETKFSGDTLNLIGLTLPDSHSVGGYSKSLLGLMDVYKKLLGEVLKLGGLKLDRVADSDFIERAIRNSSY